MSLYTTYKNNNLDAIYWQHGREQVSESRLEYYLKDHLGNTRLRVADMDGDGLISYKKYDPEHDDILSIHNYYPFGMEWDAPSKDEKGNSLVPTEPESRYTYNGKESIKELNIGLLDYGARMYDPSIARWTSVDPLADQFPGWSSYNYTMNNPINMIDPDGRAPESCPGCGFLLSWAANKASEAGYDRLAGALDVAAGTDFVYANYQSTQALSNAETTGDYVRALDPTGLTSLPGTIEAAANGDERAQGQLAAGVVLAAATKKLGGGKSSPGLGNQF